MSNYFEKRLVDNNISKDDFMNWINNRLQKLEVDFDSNNTKFIDQDPNESPKEFFNKTITSNYIFTELNNAKLMKHLIKKIESEETPNDEDEEGFEAIIKAYNRPVLHVIGGEVQEASAPIWNILSQKRDAINKTIKSIGRIELEGHPLFTNVGTGFLAGDNIIITNRHVVKTFGNENLTFIPGITSFIDYKQYVMPPAEEEEYKVEKILGIHSVYDLALLKISNTDTSTVPLSILGQEPSPIEDRDIYVCGYPGYPSDEQASDANIIFSGVYNVKRVQPGKTLPFITNEGLITLDHDCSTLNGNSGSPVIDLANNVVIGLHYFGTYKVKNRSVPLWKLSQDPLLIDNGIVFTN